MSTYENTTDYGGAFTDIRYSKELEHKDFHSVGLTADQIKAFESGELDLTVRELEPALLMMHSSLGEFEYRARGFKLDKTEQFFVDLEQCFYEGDRETLEAFATNYMTEDPAERRLAICAKACLGALTDDEEDEITAFLMTVLSWGFYDLSILSFVVDQLDSDVITDLYADIKKNAHNEMPVFKYRRRLQQVVHRAAWALIDRNDEEEARNFLDDAEEMLFERDLYGRAMHEFTEGFFLHTFGDKAAGDQQMKRVLAVYKLLGSQELLKHYQHEYHKVVD